MPDSSHPPVGENPHDPFEKFRVEGIQKDKSASSDDSDKEIKYETNPSQTAFGAYFSLLLKKFLDMFESTTELGISATSEKSVLNHLIALQAAINSLKTEDRSQDSTFLNHLSSIWHQILNDMPHFRRKTDLSKKIQELIDTFSHYPLGQLHTLGYYLTEYAGQKWLPFPYMEMISRLHLQYQKNPMESNLTVWSHALEEMIRIIQAAQTEN